MYRKFKADKVFTGTALLSGNTVLITDDNGVIIDLVDMKDAGDGIEILNGLLTPGFINCHCHLELSHMKGLIPKHTGLVDFVFKVVNERHFDDEKIYSAIEAAENEMLENGIVAAGDICNNIFTIPQKIKGRLQYHNFIEASGFPPAVAELRFKRATDFYHEYTKSLPNNSIVPHAPYSVSPEMFRLINEFPGNDILTIHNQESTAENELFETATGDLLRMYEMMGINISFFNANNKTSLQTWLPYFTKRQTIILVHNVVTSEKDVEFIKQQTPNNQAGIFFCLCPNANKYISNLLPEVPVLANSPFGLVLGTDSLASNDQLSILEEMKTLQQYFPELKLADLLQWGTINGARALNMENMLGSFEKEKRPGIVLINKLNELNLTEGSSARRIL